MQGPVLHTITYPNPLLTSLPEPSISITHSRGSFYKKVIDLFCHRDKIVMVSASVIAPTLACYFQHNGLALIGLLLATCVGLHLLYPKEARFSWQNPLQQIVY